MTNNPKDAALALAIVATIADAAKEHKDFLRARLAELFEDIGADSTKAELDGEKIAKVALVSPEPKATIVDERAFIEYVGENFPTEIVSKVRESFWAAYSKHLECSEDGKAFDPNTGEVVAGVEFRKASPYVSTRFEKQGREAILNALRNGSLALDLTTSPALPEKEQA